MDDIQESEWINAKRAFIRQPRKPNSNPPIDMEVSKAVGFNVRAGDPRLIKKIVEWKQRKDPETQDQFLRDPRKVEELKKILSNK